MQLWGHHVTSGRSCIPTCLQVPLISSSFPDPPYGTLIRSWLGLHNFRWWSGFVIGESSLILINTKFIPCVLPLVWIFIVHESPVVLKTSTSCPVTPLWTLLCYLHRSLICSLHSSLLCSLTPSSLLVLSHTPTLTLWSSWPCLSVCCSRHSLLLLFLWYNDNYLTFNIL